MTIERYIRSAIARIPAVCRREAVLVALASAVVAGLYFAPILWSCPLGQDVYRLQYAALAPRLHIPLSKAIALATNSEASVTGGWFPFASLVPAAWFFVDLRTAMPIALALVMLNVATFAYIARTLSNSGSFAALAVALVLVAMQIREPHDPLLESAIGTTFLSELMLSSFAFWLLYVERRRSLFAALSLFTFTAAALTSAVAYPFGFLFMALAIAERGRLRAIAIAAACVVPVCVLLETARSMPLPVPVVAVHDGFSDYIRDVCLQLFAALPTTFRSERFGLHPVTDFLHEQRFNNLPAITAVGWIVAAVVGISICAGLQRLRSRHGSERIGWTLALGIALWLAPALALDAGSFARSRLQPGEAFDGVWLEYFGIALLGAAALRQYVRRSNLRSASIVSMTAALFGFFAVYGNVRANDRGIEHTRSLDSMRRNIEVAARYGIFVGMHDGDVVAVDPSAYPFSFDKNDPSRSAANLFYRYTGKRFEIKSARALTEDAGKKVWAVTSDANRNGPARLTLYHLSGVGPKADSALRLVNYSSTAERQQQVLSFQSEKRGLKSSFVFVGSTAQITSAKRLCGPVALKDEFYPQRSKLIWESGIVSPDADYAGRLTFSVSPRLSGQDQGLPKWRYAGASAIASIVRDPCPRVSLRFHAFVATAAPAWLTVALLGRTLRLRASQAPTDLAIDIPPDAPSLIPIRFSTNGPAATDISMLPRTEGGTPPNYRMLIITPFVTEEQPPIGGGGRH